MSSELRTILRLTNSKTMMPLNNNSNRITRKSSTPMDNIFTNDVKHEINSEIISDHLPIYAVCTCDKLD